MDITGLPAGQYTLRAELNPPVNFKGNETRAFAESDYTNNVGSVLPCYVLSACQTQLYKDGGQRLIYFDKNPTESNLIWLHSSACCRPLLA